MNKALDEIHNGFKSACPRCGREHRARNVLFVASCLVPEFDCGCGTFFSLRGQTSLSEKEVLAEGDAISTWPALQKARIGMAPGNRVQVERITERKGEQILFYCVKPSLSDLFYCLPTIAKLREQFQSSRILACCLRWFSAMIPRDLVDETWLVDATYDIDDGYNELHAEIARLVAERGIKKITSNFPGRLPFPPQDYRDMGKRLFPARDPGDGIVVYGRLGRRPWPTPDQYASLRRELGDVRTSLLLFPSFERVALPKEFPRGDLILDASIEEQAQILCRARACITPHGASETLPAAMGVPTVELETEPPWWQDKTPQPIRYGLPPEGFAQVSASSLRLIESPRVTGALASVCDMKPVLTVGIVVMTQRDYARMAIASVLGSAAVMGAPCKVIVVCNTKSRRMKSMLDSFGERVEVLDNDGNKGYAIACNQILEETSTPYLCLAHSDVIFPRRALAELVSDLAACSPRTALVMPSTNYANEHFPCEPDLRASFSTSKGHNKKFLGKEAIQETLRSLYGDLDCFANSRESMPPEPVDDISSFCIAFRTRLLKDVGGFDNRFRLRGWEDKELFERIKASLFSARLSKKAFVHHHGNLTTDSPGLCQPLVMRRNKATFDAIVGRKKDLKEQGRLRSDSLRPSGFRSKLLEEDNVIVKRSIGIIGVSLHPLVMQELSRHDIEIEVGTSRDLIISSQGMLKQAMMAGAPVLSMSSEKANNDCPTVYDSRYVMSCSPGQAIYPCVNMPSSVLPMNERLGVAILPGAATPGDMPEPVLEPGNLFMAKCAVASPLTPAADAIMAMLLGVPMVAPGGTPKEVAPLSCTLVPPGEEGQGIEGLLRDEGLLEEKHAEAKLDAAGYNPFLQASLLARAIMSALGLEVQSEYRAYSS